MTFKNDQDMFERMKEKLYTAVCCDIMDDYGYRNQAMNIKIKPIQKGNKVVGRAKTILSTSVYEIYEEPYKGEIDAVDSLKNNEVVVMKTEESEKSGVWGELLSIAAKMKGTNGAVIDGYTRDVEEIKKLDYNVYALGFSPLDSRGRSTVIDYDCRIKCGGIEVNPGDLIFGDLDGVIVIPKSIAEKVMIEALQKVEKENKMRQGLLEGRSLKELYQEQGVL